MEYEIHPAADILPPLQEGEFQELKKNIERVGLLEGIVLLDGKIIDGRARYQACRDLGIEIVTVNVDFEVESAQDLALDLNLPHRTLNKAQRVAVALELRPALEKEAMKRRGPHKMTPEQEIDRGATAVKVAKRMSVGRTSVERGIRIQKEAPSLIPRMKAGEFPTVWSAQLEAGIEEQTKRRWVASREDHFHNVFNTLERYLGRWSDKGWAHINPREAQRRLARIAELKEKIAVMEAELEERSVKARTTGV